MEPDSFTLALTLKEGGSGGLDENSITDVGLRGSIARFVRAYVYPLMTDFYISMIYEENKNYAGQRLDSYFSDIISVITTISETWSDGVVRGGSEESISVWWDKVVEYGGSFSRFEDGDWFEYVDF